MVAHIYIDYLIYIINLFTNSIKQLTIHQSKNIDIVIIIPGILGK